MTITNDIRYIGVNDHRIDLFEGQYDVPNGILQDIQKALELAQSLIFEASARRVLCHKPLLAFRGQFLPHHSF